MSDAATSTNDATIEVPADLPLVRISREFDAPAAKVYRAHVDPDLYVQWLGPDGYAVSLPVWDARSGGEYRTLLERDGESGGGHGCFHELRDGELIVMTFTHDGAPDVVWLERLVFEDLPDGRSRLTNTSVTDSFAERDAIVAGGMQVGVDDGFAKLDAVVEAML